ncbi:MAG: polyprenyl synthetase family protein [Chlorobi bacterium]|nr:polyprenyl synthetase family protein [Chlorobiota bacterium]
MRSVVKGGNPLKEARLFLGEDWKRYREILSRYMRGRIPLLDRILRFIMRYRGKEMRPLFLLLTARLFGRLNESVHRAAVMVEILHNATLVHDDVVDDALKRRGFFSVKTLWGNRIAVLVGDFLLARGLLLAVDNNDWDSLRVLSRAVKAMSEGELFQAETARKHNWTEQIYFEIIRLKTASLFAVCTGLAAKVQGLPEEDVEKWYWFGEQLGIAFQIQDDVLDFQKKTGKSMGQDVKEGKLSLPVIYAMEKMPLTKKWEFLRLLRNASKKKNFERIKSIVEEYDGFTYARNKANFYMQRAYEFLKQFSDREAYPYLKNLIDFILRRDK